MSAYTVTVTANAWEGIYRHADTPTIVINGYGQGGVSDGLYPIGATSWTVYNSSGATVASGTCATTVSQITVATSGVWVSGGSVGIDDYQFVVNQSAPSVQGGGVATWHQASAPTSGQNDEEIWWGEVTTTGSNIPLYVSGIPGAQLWSAEIDEFSSGLSSPTWAQINSSVVTNGSSTTVAFPSLTATANNQLYVGCAEGGGSTISAGSTSGYTYTPQNGTGANPAAFCYNLNLSSGTTSPTCSQASAGVSYATGVILGASGTGSISMSHVGVWTNGNSSSGASSYVVNVSPHTVGNVLVLQHATVAGASGSFVTSPQPIGCYFYVGATPQGFDPVAEGYTVSTGNSFALCAWMGTAQDRGQYSWPQSSASQIASNYASDPYFQGPGLDSARPHTLWLATSTSGTYQSPTAAQYGTFVSQMVTNGFSGATYEVPTNEPEDEGWSQANIISGINTDATAILAADSSAKLIGYCSGGIYNNSSASEFTAVINATSLNGTSGHHENSYENQPDIVSLRQDYGGISTAIAASSSPHLTFWDTETGNYGCYYGVYHMRRHAAHCTKLAMVRELNGFPKENLYFFDTVVGADPSDPSGFIEGGSIRAGAVAMHVMSEALRGTTCSPTSKPTQLSFGSASSPGDTHFLGLHYSSSSLSRDVILLASTFTADTVTLNVGSSGAASAATAQNGFGTPVMVTVTGTQITVPTDDLVTAVFLPLSTTVSVVDTGSNIISVANVQANLVQTAETLVNESSASVSPIGSGSWGHNYINDPPSPGAPYFDATIPASVVASNFGSSGGTVAAGSYIFALKGVPPWNPSLLSQSGKNYGASAPIAFEIVATIGGSDTTVYSYSNATAVSVAAPGTPGNVDPAVRTTWWDHASAFAGSFSLSGAATKLKLVVTQTSLAGEPDSAAATIGNNSSTFNSANQAFQGAEWQVYQAPSGGSSSSTGGGGQNLRLMRLSVG